MTFIYIIIGAVIIGVAYAIYNGIQNSKHKNTSKDIFDNLEDFKADEVYLSLKLLECLLDMIQKEVKYVC